MKKKKSVNPQTKKQNKIQKKKVFKICFIVIALIIASASVYLGVTVFQQVEGFSKENLLFFVLFCFKRSEKVLFSVSLIFSGLKFPETVMLKSEAFKNSG